MYSMSLNTGGEWCGELVACMYVYVAWSESDECT